MKKTTILFDLDGTLLPMDQEAFVRRYLDSMAAFLEPYGYEPGALQAAVIDGVVAMVKNRGKCLNERLFWDAFRERMGQPSCGEQELFETYYRGDFQTCRELCGFNENAALLMAQLKSQGLQAVLATNPLFPAIATHSRVRWAGLSPEDFIYISTFENSSFCKPSPAYYREILDKLGLSPEECVMVGNDTREDVAAEQLGIPVFLLTDCLIDRDGLDLSSYPHGGFEELKAYIGSL